MINLRSLTTAEYETLRFSLITSFEDYDPEPYIDSANIVTIGYGFNIEELGILDVVLEQGFGMNLSLARDEAFRDSVLTITRNNSLSETDVRLQLNSLYEAYTGVAGATFQIPSMTAARDVFDALTPVFETKLDNFLPSPMGESRERLALLSLAYNQDDSSPSPLLGTKLQNALAANDRAAAWFEIVYNSNGQGGNFANRRYLEGAMFGLFSSDNPSPTEANATLDFYLSKIADIRIYEAANFTAAKNEIAQNSEFQGIVNSFAPPLHYTATDYLKPISDVIIERYVSDTNVAASISSRNFDAVVLGLIGLDKDRPNRIAAFNHRVADTDDLLINIDDADSEIGGGIGDDVLIGNAKIDTLRGLEGDDVLIGEGGNDILTGWSGEDILYGGEGNDKLYAQTESDFSSTDRDELYGGECNDELYGDNGNDLLDGGTGADRLEGKGGNDSYYVDNQGDIIVEKSNEGDNDNLFVLANYDLADDVHVENIFLLDDPAVNNFSGNNLDNTIHAATVGAAINGEGGADTIYGGEGIDIIDGGSENDTIYGGGNSDTLIGGQGADELYGGEGYDTYITDAEDIIQDSDGIGRVELNGNILTGGKRVRNSITRRYIGDDGQEYVYDDVSGSLFVVGGPEIKNFVNGMLGITLSAPKKTPPPPPPPPPPKPPVPPSDPLTLDLNGDGVIDTLSLADGVNFDLNNNGFSEKTAWLASDDGFLVLDKDGNGLITEGNELFGTETLLENGEYASKGYEALIELDDNEDGKISSADSIYSDLLVWRDLNSNGISEANELLSLSDLNITEISVNYAENVFTDANNVQHREHSTFTYADGTTAITNTLWFEFDSRDTIPVEVHNGEGISYSEDIAALPDAYGFGNVYSLRHAMSLDQSGELQRLVGEFVTESDSAQRKSLLTQIILTWSGQTDTDPLSRGNGIDGQKLGVVEAFWGDSALVEQPQGEYAALLETVYQGLEDSLYTQLMAQSHFIDLFELVVFDDASNVETADFSQVNQYFFDLFAIEDASSLDLWREFEGFAVGMSPYGEKNVYQTFIESFEQGAIASSRLVRDTALELLRDGDTITGSDGNERLSGGDGDDIIVGGAGNDVLIGGEGRDVYEYKLGDGNDRIRNKDEDVNSFDRLNFDNSIAPEDVTLSRQDDALLIRLVNGDAITVESFFVDDAANGYGLDAISFANGSEWTLEQIKEMVQQPTNEADHIYGYAIDDTLSGEDGNDTIEGADGDDWISGGVGSDELRGDGGNDTLVGGEGDDVLIGGNGQDIYVYNLGDGNDRISNKDEDASSIDTLQFGAQILPNEVSLIRESDNLLIHFNNGETLTVDSFFVDDGGNGYGLDLITFTDGTTWGLEQVKAFVQVPTDGDDRIYGYATDETLVGGQGRDTIIGQAGNDTLLGELGNDNLNGGTGNDILDGGEGDDFLSGGDGADIYRFGVGYGKDRIFEESSLEEGAIIEMVGDLTASDISFHRYNEDLVIYINGNYEDVLRIDNYFIASRPIDKITFTDGTMLEAINTAGVFLEADRAGINFMPSPNEGRNNETGNAAIFINSVTREERGYYLGGTDKSDVLVGKALDDELRGFEGDDVLVGGAGDDKLYGGDGEDRYVIGRESGRDIIYDDNDINTVVFSDDISPADLYIDGVGQSYWEIFLGEDQSIVLEASTISTFEFSDGTTLDKEGLVNAIAEANNAPIVNQSIDDQVHDEDQFFDIDLPLSSIFSDSDYRSTLSFSALLEDGSELPDWLTFDENGLRGTGDNSAVGSYTLVITATDNYGAQTSTSMSLEISNVNDAPVVSVQIEDITVAENEAIDWFLPTDTFNDIDGDVLSLNATLSDGSALPAWMVFDSDTGHLVGTPPDDVSGAIDIMITATDPFGEQASSSFQLLVQSPDDSGGSDGGSGDGSNGGGTNPNDLSGNDDMVGTDWGDVLVSGDGDDHLTGLQGDDYLFGGAGNDTYIIGTSSGKDSIIDVEGQNVIRFVDGIGFNDVASGLVRSGNDLILRISGGLDEVKINNFFSLANTIERLEFENGSQITASQLYGAFGISPPSENGTAQDILVGDSNDNNLAGTASSDIILGDIGADTISGNEGDDYLFGETGNDTYLIGRNSGKDTIIENVGQNVVRFVEGITFSEVASGLLKSGDDLILRIANSNDEVKITKFFTQANTVERFEFDTGGQFTASQIFQVFGIMPPSSNTSTALNSLDSDIGSFVDEFGHFELIGDFSRELESKSENQVLIGRSLKPMEEHLGLAKLNAQLDGIIAVISDPQELGEDIVGVKPIDDRYYITPVRPPLD